MDWSCCAHKTQTEKRVQNFILFYFLRTTKKNQDISLGLSKLDPATLKRPKQPKILFYFLRTTKKTKTFLWAFPNLIRPHSKDQKNQKFCFIFLNLNFFCFIFFSYKFHHFCANICSPLSPVFSNS
tara:strand:+ start:4886 stop:5263 length:378 start_codon:yes stop_codon:yes gene_type:complete